MASLITLAGFSHQATCGSQGAVGEPPRDVVSTALGSGCLQAQSSLACISEQDTWEGMVSVPGRARHRNSGAHGLMSRCPDLLCGHCVWTFLILSVLISRMGSVLQTREDRREGV